MKSKINIHAMLLILVFAAWNIQAQEITGYSPPFNFDARVTHLQGTVSNEGTAIEGAVILLMNTFNSYETTSGIDGSYSIDSVPMGNYMLSATRTGYYLLNQEVFITGDTTQIIDISLIPYGDESLIINNSLTAFADDIVEDPPNFFTLTGNVHINNILHFDGDIKIDKRPNLVHPVLKGNCKLFADGIADTDYWVKENNNQFEYLVIDDRLVPLSVDFLIGGAFFIGGFNITIGEIIIDPEGDYVEIKSIVEMPFPINKVKDYLLGLYELELPMFVEQMSGSHILSKTDGVQTAMDISGLSVNIGIVSLEDVSLYYNTYTQTFGGGFTLNIPGGLPDKRIEPDSTLLDIETGQLPVEIRDENGNLVDSLTFNEFIEVYRSGGFALLSFGAEVEFVEGAINKIILFIGTKVPIGATGLFLTKVTGGIDDLATGNWKIIANVDIELGYEVPVLGSPVKLENFGVLIQPWQTFRGGGSFKVFNYEVSNGYIEYNRPLNSLSAECNLNLYGGLLKGRTYMSLVGGHVNGSGLLSIQTPGNLPWFLRWARNRKIGTATADLNNQYFQSSIRIGWLKLAQKLKFGKTGFPWFNYYIGRNLGHLHKIWKGQKDGKQAITFLVAENARQLLVVAMDTLNPATFHFTLQHDSTGVVYNQDNAYHYKVDSIEQQTIMSVLSPMKGEWTFFTEYAGEIEVFIASTDQEPTLLVSDPSERRTRSNQISLSFNDYSDTLNVQVYYSNSNKYFNGTMINEFTIINNGSLDFTWQNDDVPNGEYFIYSRIDDGYNEPVLQFAPGSIWVENEAWMELPQNLKVVQADDILQVNWDEPVSGSIIAATVYYRNISSGRTEDESVFGENSIEITGLKPGQEYKLWACFIDEYGSFSQPSQDTNVIFTSSDRNNPPYFTLNPDSIFVFVEEQEWRYKLSAKDADGDALLFNIPNDTLGITLSNDTLIWTPGFGLRDIYELMITVTDGSDIDTTWQQLAVHPKHQVDVDLSFSSVNLYEDDNMFVKIRNFLCEDFYQQVTLRNTRTQELVNIETRRVNDFDYIGQFGLSFIKKSEIAVANGDTIEAKYIYLGDEFYAYAYYDSTAQATDKIAPGTIADLTTERMPENMVKLKWTATGNDVEIGKAYRYDIRYAYTPINSEDAYLIAHRIFSYPYPSLAGLQDSLIINLMNLDSIAYFGNIYFSIKAEDEAQNRGALSNSPALPCMLNPVNLSAGVEDVYKIALNWGGPLPGGQNSAFKSYKIFRKINQGALSLLQSGVTQTEFVDDLKDFPDGTYQYAIQAVYENGSSDLIFASPVVLERFVNVNMLLSLEGRTNYNGIAFEMIGLDTVYSQQFNRTTNTTGLLLLPGVFYGQYAVTALKDGFFILYDTVTVTKYSYSFNLQLASRVPIRRFVHGYNLIADTCFDAVQDIIVDNLFLNNESSKVLLIAGKRITINPASAVENGAYLHAFIDESGYYCQQPEAFIAADDEEESSSDLLNDKHDNADSFFSLYPNPTKGKFTLKLAETEELASVVVEVYSMIGERLLQAELAGQSQYNFDLTSSPQGIYLVKVLKGNLIDVKRIIRN
ncbi:MAG: carboxypeptidase regulatory-like domain-containing protein [Bacteroidales bacterium]|nr:carboxypeptidase regulatory-like domain-containing protein [Bacteroidales bacterium]